MTDYDPADYMMAAQLVEARDDDPELYRHLLKVTLAEYGAASIITVLADCLKVACRHIGDDPDFMVRYMVEASRRMYEESFTQPQGDRDGRY